MTAPILAIDFGTIHTKAAYYDERCGGTRLIDLGREPHQEVIPSVFYLPKEGHGKILVGNEAHDMRKTDPQGIVETLKREIHNDDEILLGPGRVAIGRKQLAAELFRHIRERCRQKEFAKLEITACCLTVPSLFSEPHRKALREAAELGGFLQITILDEPEAAAKAWLDHACQSPGDFMVVCDISDRTVHLALVRRMDGQITTEASIMPADIELRPSEVAEIVNQVADGTRRFVEECAAAGRRNVPILLVGGGSQLAGLKAALEALKLGQVLHWNRAPYAVVLGAACRAGSHPSILSSPTVGPESIALFRQALSMAAADGKITHEEVAQLKRLVCDLRLTSEIIVAEVSKCLKTGTVVNRKDELIQSLCAVAATEPPCGAGVDSTGLRQRITADQETIQRGAADCLFEEDSIERLSAKRAGDWKAAASLGWSEGLWLMGLYHRANSMEPDPALAVRCLQKAADAGFTQAQVSLADCYQKGEGVPMDHAKAVQFLQSAAKTGNRDAAVSLAVCFFEGKGVPQNYEEALRLFRAAAQKGDSSAHLFIGLCYLNGTGVQESASEAQFQFKQLYEACQRGIKAGGKWTQLYLGVCYLNGFGVTANPQVAAEWFGKAAAQRCAAAQVQLADCYYDGIGVAADSIKAVDLLRKAAAQGDENAQNKLGFCLLRGIGGATDPAAACEWFRKSAERGDAEGQHQLGRCLIYGIGVQANESDGYRWIKRAAEQAHALAENDMGSCLQNGIGVQPDPQEAVRWYRKSAAQNCPDGLFNLALCYHAGVGVEHDQREAVVLFRKGAELGDSDSMVRLGAALCGDNMSPTDKVYAVSWFRRAAEQKHPEALFQLGCCHVGGTGVSQDEATGFSLIQEAAELGWAAAQSSVGDCWLTGNYFPANSVEAVKWFRKAAEQGDYEGQIGLGKCYLNGWGVPRDVRAAAQWLQPAADAGYPEATTSLGECYATGEL